MNYSAVVLKTIIIHSGHGHFFFFPKCIIKILQSWDKARKGCLETKDGRNQGFLPSSAINLFTLLFLSFPANGLACYNALAELSESRAAFKVQLLVLLGKREQRAHSTVADQIECCW